MITKTFICDECKQSVGEADLVPVSISFDVKSPNGGYKRNCRVNKDICKCCLGKHGLLTEGADGQEIADAVTQNERTLNKILIELLEELGVAFTD